MEQDDSAPQMIDAPLPLRVANHVKQAQSLTDPNGLSSTTMIDDVVTVENIEKRLAIIETKLDSTHRLLWIVIAGVAGILINTLLV